MTMPFSVDGRTLRRCTPHGPPFTLLDRVEQYHPDRRLLTAIKMVSQNEPFLQGHFPDFPILPGVIVIEALAQTSGMLMNFDHWLQQGVKPEDVVGNKVAGMQAFLAESRIKHVSGIYPGDRVTLESQVTMQRGEVYVFKVCAYVDGRESTKGQLTLARNLSSGA